MQILQTCKSCLFIWTRSPNTPPQAGLLEAPRMPGLSEWFGRGSWNPGAGYLGSWDGVDQSCWGRRKGLENGNKSPTGHRKKWLSLVTVGIQASGNKENQKPLLGERVYSQKATFSLSNPKLPMAGACLPVEPGRWTRMGKTYRTHNSQDPYFYPCVLDGVFLSPWCLNSILEACVISSPCKRFPFSAWGGFLILELY